MHTPHLRRHTAMLAAAAALALAAPTAALAGTTSGTDTPRDRRAHTTVVGGTPGGESWVVQLRLGNRYEWMNCSGNQISDRWILTARHCIDGDGDMDVYFSSSTTRPGTPVRADKLYASPSNDVALVHLSQPRRAWSYAPLTDNYRVNVGDSGTIMGFGLRANKREATQRYEADVTVDGTGYDVYGARGIHLVGENGTANHGDSGGPLVVNGAVVGVCSAGDSDDPGADIHAGVTYASVTTARSWIRRVSGV